MNADGTNQTNLANTPGDDRSPAWSPDGTQLAFTSGRDFNLHAELYVMNADGTNQTRLTNTLRNEDDPSWQALGAPAAIRYHRANHNDHHAR